jgi:hypothetical protein
MLAEWKETDFQTKLQATWIKKLNITKNIR